jgi:galactose oxidase-like protein
MKPSSRLPFLRLAILVLLPCFFVSCGTSTKTTAPPATFNIGGMVSGLAGTGLVLQNNSSNNLPVTANGSFTFTTAVASGGAYAVTVFSQPSNPAQNCVVTSGSGNASANITSVQVTCSTVTFTIGGIVTNLVGSGLVLQDNGGNNLSVTSNGSFTFTTAVAIGGAYVVTVSTQPSSPAQTCGVVNGSGAANANVTTVIVNCGHNEWAWMSGANAPGQNGTYGTQGTAAPANVPGVRNFGPVSWTDASGNLWLFGGNGLDSAGATGDLNDLWKYNITSNEWTWVSASNLISQKGTYGTLGTAAPANVPGARDSAVSWKDTSGNLWVFGGFGFDSAGTSGELSDLWKYTVSSGEWTWMNGPNLVNQIGTYGTQGTPTSANVPGGRSDLFSWTDPSGNFWLFGGFGYDSTNPATGLGNLNDLWKYTVSSGEWTWMNGPNLVNQIGTYGTQGILAPGNIPGNREGGASWADASGNLWLFGGSGILSVNDLWMYMP